GQTNRCDFWRAIRATRQIVIVQWLRTLSRYFFHANDTFGRSHVCKSWSFNYITDSVYSLDVSLVKIIHYNLTFVSFHAEILQTNTLHVGRNTNRRQNDIAFYFDLAIRSFHS